MIHENEMNEIRTTNLKIALNINLIKGNSFTEAAILS